MMNKPKIQSLVTILKDSGLYPGTPAQETKSRVQRLAKKGDASHVSAREGNADEEADVGYESSWSGIFTSTRGVIDKNGP